MRSSTDISVTVSRLHSDNVALLRELNQLFAAAFGDPEVYTHAPPDDAYLCALLGKEHVVALVALVAGQVVGGLVAYELEKFERARSELYIYDLAVAEDYRRRGVATALIKRLQAIAASRGVWVIYVQADYGDNAAIGLYEKLGVREDVMHFDIPIVTCG
ncbi:MAG: AAC(3)-I family aminoglycoside N-acetyltransferase [Steroidobacteraceae bacterium]